ncbi:Aurora kinase A [Halotydeus destructor]|nr:Aurora kinase A [Halotydeus destructor]
MASQPRSGHQDELSDGGSETQYYDCLDGNVPASGSLPPVRDQAYSPGATPVGRSVGARKRISISDFQDIQFVGEGQFAKVYLARESRYNFKVALKEIARDATNKDRIALEYEIHRSLRHPKIISLYGHFDHGPFHYLIMEFAPYGNLRRELTLKGPFNDSVAAPFIDQILQAASYCHSKGIMHRDIKPANILLCGAGIVKLADFGISVDPRDSMFTLCGTSSYIAPEIIAGEKYDYRVDNWSIGVVAYELLKGVTPFKSNHDYATRVDIINGKYVETGLSVDAKSFISSNSFEKIFPGTGACVRMDTVEQSSQVVVV